MWVSCRALPNRGNIFSVVRLWVDAVAGLGVDVGFLPGANRGNIFCTNWIDDVIR